MKFQINVEYGQDELVKFYTEADVVDGIVRNYSFSSLVEDIRRTCEAATSHFQHFANTIQGRRWRFICRLRAVSNFGDRDCVAGEIHTRAREISRRRDARGASSRNFTRARVYFARPTITIAKIRDYSQSSLYVNLNMAHTDNFQEMFVRARSVDEGIYRKILLRVSERDSPVVFRIWRFMPQN